MEKKCLPASFSKTLFWGSLVFSVIACCRCSQNTMTCSTWPSFLGEWGRADCRGRGNYLRDMGKVLCPSLWSYCPVRGESLFNFQNYSLWVCNSCYYRFSLQTVTVVFLSQVLVDMVSSSWAGQKFLVIFVSGIPQYIEKFPNSCICCATVQCSVWKIEQFLHNNLTLHRSLSTVTSSN